MRERLASSRQQKYVLFQPNFVLRKILRSDEKRFAGFNDIDYVEWFYFRYNDTQRIPSSVDEK